MDPITKGNRSREAEPEDRKVQRAAGRGSPGGREAQPGSREVTPEVYWRRRVIALAAVLAVLGLLAWAVGGAAVSHPVAAKASFSNQSQPLAAPTGYPSPAASSASPASSPSPSSPGHSAPASPGGSKNPRQQGKKPAAAVQRHRAGQPAVTGINAPGDDCPAGDVVLSLAASGSTFATAVRPRLTISVVSTASQVCRFNVGRRYLTVVIESGKSRVWGSGDCVRGGGTQVAMLARGVPVRRTLTWNRTRSAPGCHLPATAARPGTYTATASDAGVHSHTVKLQLRLGRWSGH